MTTTALMPVDPAVSPQHAARILPIRANLLPSEISDGRRARRTRAVVLVAVVLVLGLLGGWYWTAAAEKRDADEEFAQVTRQITAVQGQQTQYQKLTQTKNSQTVLKQQLGKLTTADLSWQNLLDLLRETGAKADANLNKITGGLNEGSTTSTSGELGELILTGSAPDKKAVARYVDALAKLTYVTDPFVTSVTYQGDKENVNFSLNLVVTDKALCGRFSKTDCKSGGK